MTDMVRDTARAAEEKKIPLAGSWQAKSVHEEQAQQDTPAQDGVRIKLPPCFIILPYLSMAEN